MERAVTLLPGLAAGKPCDTQAAEKHDAARLLLFTLWLFPTEPALPAARECSSLPELFIMSPRSLTVLGWSCVYALAIASARPAESAVLVYSKSVRGPDSGHSAVQQIVGVAAAVDRAGNLYVAGHAVRNHQRDGVVYRIPADGRDGDAWYFGGADKDEARGIAVDAAGDIYITGITESRDFPVQNAYQPAFGGGFDEASGAGPSDAFVLKLRWGTGIVYSTYLGGDGNDGGRAIAVDPAGSAYVTGLDFSTSGFQHTRSFGPSEFSRDAFVTKLTPSGNGVVYSAQIGGTSTDEGYGIAVDGSGRAHVVGLTHSGWDPNGCNCSPFPTHNALQPAHAGATFGADGFLLTLTPDGTELVQSTFLGGAGDDIALGIALDAEGNNYLTGWTKSVDFPTANAYQATRESETDAFVTKIDATGTALVYSTYLGGTSVKRANAIAVDAAGSAHIAGVVFGANFPLVRRQANITQGSGEAFLTQFAPDGASLVHSTALTSVNHLHEGTGIALDAVGNEYVSGFHTDLEDAQLLAFKLTPSVRLEENSASISYAGNWTNTSYAELSGGSARRSDQAGERATLRFSGTGFSWISGKTTVGGVAAVSIDGGAPVSVDLYAQTDPRWSGDWPVFTAVGLADGDHVVTIDVTGRTNNQSSGFWVMVDAFEIVGTPLTPLPTATPTAAPTPARRIQQNDAAVHTAGGTWYTHSSPVHSGGSAVLSMDRPTTATDGLFLTFEGTGVRWIGVKDPWSGIANVVIDNRHYTVDTFSAVQQIQVEMLTVTGLPPGAHTLRITPTGQRHPASDGNWIWVDAFDIFEGGGPTPTATATPPVSPTPTVTPTVVVPTPTPTPTPTPAATPGALRVEDGDPRVIFAGQWHSNGSAVHSGGSARLAMEAGSTATLAFDGTGVRWVGVRDQWSGIADVYIDGAKYSTVDTYAASEQSRAVLFAASGLTPGSHTVRIEATGTRNDSSGGAWIWVDAFDVTSTPGPAPTATPTATPTPTGGPTVMPTPTPTPTPTPGPAPAIVRHEDDAAVYSEGWFTNTAGVHSGRQARFAMDPGNRATFSFNGTGVSWIGYADEWSGIARVLVDGVLQATVDNYASPQHAQKRLHSVGGLAPGSHTITIEVTGTRNPSSGGQWVWIDAFDVTAGP
jgi:hypothetical protein